MLCWFHQIILNQPFLLFLYFNRPKTVEWQPFYNYSDNYLKNGLSPQIFHSHPNSIYDQQNMWSILIGNNWMTKIWGQNRKKFTRMSKSFQVIRFLLCSKFCNFNYDKLALKIIIKLFRKRSFRSSMAFGDNNFR